MNLSNPSAPAALYPFASALVNLLDDNTGVSFTNSNFGVLKSGTNVIITVTRTNADTGLATVNFGTRDLTALANVIIIPPTASSPSATASSSSPLPCRSSITARSRAPRLCRLSPYQRRQPRPAELLPPSTALVTITDDIAGLSFSSPAYQVSANSGQAIISVVRTGFTNCSLTVGFATTSGTNSGSAIPGVNYMPTNGALFFTNGVPT